MKVEEPNYKTFDLEKLKLCLLSKISPGITLRAAAFDAVEFMADEMAIRITAYITSQKLEEVAAKWPADWWQAFKERWFPRVENAKID